MTKSRVLVAAILVVLSATALAKPAEVRIEISDSGRYTLQGKPVALSDLRARLLELKAAHADAQVHVSGGDKVSHAQVASVMKLVEEAGLAHLRFVTDWPDAPASSVSASPASGARR